MKNLSLVINAILAVCVIILFVMYSSLKNGASGGSQNGVQVTATSAMKQKNLKVAYVNADSINVNYDLMRDFKKEMQTRQTALQNEYDVKSRKLQQEYMEYQQKAQSGNISQLDAQKAQQDMEGKKSELDGLQRQQDELIKEVQARNQDIQIKVQDYIIKYNKQTHFDYVLTYSAVGGPLLYANDSLDITRDILKGLNKMYSDSLQKAPKH